MDYILVGVATLLLAFEFACSKKYQMNEGTDISAGLKFNAVSGLLTVIVFFALTGFKFEFTLFSLIMAFAMATCAAVYSIIGFRVLKMGNMSVYSMFLMSGGMLLPYVFGLAFLGETINPFRVVGIIVILGAVVLSNFGKMTFKPSLLLLCLAVFLLNGCVSIVSKCHQANCELELISNFETVGSTAFVMYAGLAKFILSSVALLFCKRHKNTENTKRTFFASKLSFIVILGAAAIGGVSYMLQLIGAKTLPATVLYPMVTGGSIIFSSLSGLIFFKEKLSIFQIISVVLAFAGTLLFL